MGRQIHFVRQELKSFARDGIDVANHAQEMAFAALGPAVSEESAVAWIVLIEIDRLLLRAITIIDGKLSG